ncbi:MAG: hypothetical protein ACRD2W_15835 [Acidimicrobiales bacterium]
MRALMRNLDDDCVQTLDLLAVLGSRAELNDLTRLAGRPGDAVAVALDRLVRRRLVREDPSGPPPSRSRTRSCRT